MISMQKLRSPLVCGVGGGYSEALLNANELSSGRCGGRGNPQRVVLRSGTEGIRSFKLIVES